MAFDNSFVVMNEEEMHDVNGGWFGWTKHKGADAWIELSFMCANAVGWFKLQMKMTALTMGLAITSVTVVGALLTILSAAGLAFTQIMTIANTITTIQAFIYTLIDGGFKSRNFGAFGLGLNLVKRL